MWKSQEKTIATAIKSVHGPVEFQATDKQQLSITSPLKSNSILSQPHFQTDCDKFFRRPEMARSLTERLRKSLWNDRITSVGFLTNRARVFVSRRRRPTGIGSSQTSESRSYGASRRRLVQSPDSYVLLAFCKETWLFGEEKRTVANCFSKPTDRLSV